MEETDCCSDSHFLAMSTFVYIIHATSRWKCVETIWDLKAQVRIIVDSIKFDSFKGCITDTQS
eukprot:5050409-Pyramimonas_sp.AAC.4